MFLWKFIKDAIKFYISISVLQGRYYQNFFYFLSNNYVHKHTDGFSGLSPPVNLGGKKVRIKKGKKYWDSVFIVIVIELIYCMIAIEFHVNIFWEFLFSHHISLKLWITLSMFHSLALLTVITECLRFSVVFKFSMAMILNIKRIK